MTRASLRRWLGPPLPRAEGVGDRLVAVGLAARFVDELLSTSWDVLMPTLRRSFGLSYAQVGGLRLALDLVAGVVEPLNGIWIDLGSRRAQMALGAAALGLSMLAMAGAPGLPLLVAGFALYGLGSGPLAHTADVVLVDAHPQAPERIFARATAVDTAGALLAPLLVAGGLAVGLGWRTILAGLGALALAYALWIAGTRFPRSAAAASLRAAGERRRVRIRANLAAVLSSPPARYWLLFLFLEQAADAAWAFVTIWLAERGGLSASGVALYMAMMLAVSLASIALLERLLARLALHRLLLAASLGLCLLYPLWLASGDAELRLWLLGPPVAFLAAWIWPLAKSSSLVSVPGLGGTVTALQSLLGLLPLALLLGLAAEAWALTPVLALVLTGSAVAMAALGLLAPERDLGAP